MISSLIILVCFFSFGGWTGYVFLTKSVNKVSSALKPRTGQEIYTALFGKDETGCVVVTKSHDQVIPKIDVAIWLQFQTCPTEVKRILKLHTFTFEKMKTDSWNESAVPYGESIDWINPTVMGDTLNVFEYISEDGRNVQTLWTSRDSTRVVCRDIFD